MGGVLVAPRPVSHVVSTLWVRVLTGCGHRSSRGGRVSTETGLRILQGAARRSDEPAEQLVAEQAAARRQDDPIVVGDVEQLGGQRPAERVVEGRLVGRRERDAAVRPQAEDDLLRRPPSPDRSPPSRPAGGWPLPRRPGRAPRGSRRGGPRSSAASTPSKACAPGPDRLVRPALPVDEVVPALVAGPRPVADLVAVPAVLGQAMDGVVVLGRGAILVLGRACGRAPATRAGRRRQVVAAGPGQPLGVGVVEGQGVERQVVGLEGERRLERLDPVDQRSRRARRTAGRG